MFDFVESTILQLASVSKSQIMGCGNSRVQHSTGAKPEKQATLATEVERARSSELPAK
jgi:hypothetical protein